MTTAAVTMVWNDAWFLRRWLDYFSRHLGRENLYVFAHGGEPEILALCQGTNVSILPRDQITVDFDHDRWALLSHVTSGLTRFYDTVLCLDVDELLIPTTADKSLADVLANLPKGQVWAVPGFELFRTSDDGVELPETDPIAPLCRSALFSPFYSKSCIAGRAVRFTPGGHGLYDEPPEILTDLALLHLRFVNRSEHLRRRTLRRQLADDAYSAAKVTVRDMRPSGRLVSWKAADARHAAIFDLFHNTAEVDWNTAFASVKTQLPALLKVRDTQHSFGKDATTDIRTQLPDHALTLF